MELLEFDTTTEGVKLNQTPLSATVTEASSETRDLVNAVHQARADLVESLCDLDETLLEIFLESEDPLAVSAADIDAAIRRVTIANQGVPVLCGSAFRNTGVQPLLDAVINYLPCPADVPNPTVVVPGSGSKHPNQVVTVPLVEGPGRLCALAFKVIYDSRRGPMVFVRVYSGTLAPRMTLINTHNREKERANKLLTMYADDVEEVAEIPLGGIGVILGLKHTRTGDTLVDSAAVSGGSGRSPKLAALPKLRGLEPPPPVFFCSVEPHSVTEEKALTQALNYILLEDPSLHVSTDPESGQTILSGMGELHLDIVKDRLLRDYKVKADVGGIRIAYRETISRPSGDVVVEYDKEVLGKRGRAGITVALEPREELADSDSDPESGSAVDRGANSIDVSELFDSLTQEVPDREVVEEAVRAGIQQALSRGELLGFSLVEMRVRASHLRWYGEEDSSPAALRACAVSAVRQALQQTTCELLEPLMNVVVQVPESYLGPTLSDLSGVRRGRVSGLGADDNTNTNPSDDTESESDSSGLYGDYGGPSSGGQSGLQVIHAQVPLSSMVGYSSALRSLTAGTGTFTMHLTGYGRMTAQQKKTVIQETRGY
ncbi:elongation factor G, domain II-domain-containing protein [Dimargaris cristalligena]|uniref:Elongation factor G, domain II-domain-containing protein n=1 Tax=Dimargaris cristalligena TaxID=215637 RepID=A0A4P9ZLS9_9FUNG|nr:elongation factor G, domain II-domain-containing protein [Dimargaris cristalligena]|eukprot:RKP34266.1 elongation factor G, domain II-domain-containing protein [Dimargaris cristalligena]